MFRGLSRPQPGPIKNNEQLFESFPHGTLALMGIAAGVIAVTTLAMEILTERLHAGVLELAFGFVSVPMGVATMILAGLMARTHLKLALPALFLGLAYWVTYVVWMLL
jgi:hypothetical protein